MKHIIFYISLILIAILLVVIIKVNQEIIPLKLYTVDTYYSYMIEDDETIDVIFYLNGKHPLTDQDNYMEVNLSSEDLSEMLSLSIDELKSIGHESYLGETYTKYMLKLNMPSINQSFAIDELYLNVRLLNDDEYQFYLGSLSLYMSNDPCDALNWHALEGIKEEQSKLSRLYQIYISYQNLSKGIEDIYIGYEHPVSFDISNDKITLTIKDERKLLYGCPIVITFNDHTSQVIDYFIYINDYEILKESGMLLHGYLLS